MHLLLFVNGNKYHLRSHKRPPNQSPSIFVVGVSRCWLLEWSIGEKFVDCDRTTEFGRPHRQPKFNGQILFGKIFVRCVGPTSSSSTGMIFPSVIAAVNQIPIMKGPGTKIAMDWRSVHNSPSGKCAKTTNRPSWSPDIVNET